MKLKFTTTLNTIEGEPIIEVFQDAHGNASTVMDKGKPKRLSAWDVARTCLMSDIKADGPLAQGGQRPESVDGSEKFKRMDLALKILDANRRGEEVDLATEELVLLKGLSGKLYTSNAVYAFYRFIEGKEQCQPVKAEGGDKVVPIGGPVAQAEAPAQSAAAQ